jgi:hypothetical protein
MLKSGASLWQGSNLLKSRADLAPTPLYTSRTPGCRALQSHIIFYVLCLLSLRTFSRARDPPRLYFTALL